MQVDVNADLGESFGPWPMGDDKALLGVVTSANIACGFHAGDPAVLVETCHEAVARDVAIGAHVGYRDLAGFGRSFIDVEPARLYADVLYQLAAIAGIARVVGGRLAYVKPHGALYNACVTHGAQAQAVASAVSDFSGRLAVLGLPGSQLLRRADLLGLRTVVEAFADRAYTSTGELVSRREAGAVLSDPEQVAERAVEMVTTGRVRAIDGSTLHLEPDSLCVHGDTPGAVAMARAVVGALTEAGVEVVAFA